MPNPSLAHRSNCLCALLLVLAVAPVQAEDFSGVAIDFTRDNNVSRAAGNEAVGASSGELSAWRGHHWQNAGYTGLELTGTIARRLTNEPSALSATRLGVSTVVRHKFGLGDQVPELSVGGSVERNTPNDARRNTWRYQANAALRKRTSDLWQWTLSASYDKQDGDLDDPKQLPAPLPSLPGNPWDQQSWQLALAVEWDAGPDYWFTAALTHRHGDIVSSVLPPTPILFVSRAVSLDPAFGSAIVAYRLPATTHMLAVDGNLALSDSSSVYLGVERQLSTGSGSLTYGVGIIRAGFIHSF